MKYLITKKGIAGSVTGKYIKPNTVLYYRCHNNNNNNNLGGEKESEPRLDQFKSQCMKMQIQCLCKMHATQYAT